MKECVIRIVAALLIVVMPVGCDRSHETSQAPETTAIDDDESAEAFLLEPEFSWDSVRSPTMSVYVEPMNAVLVKGRWRLDETTDRALVAPLTVLNSAQVTCIRDTRTCVEELALLNSPLDGDRGIGQTILEPMTFQYDVIQWTEQRVVARNHAPVVVMEIVVSWDNVIDQQSGPLGVSVDGDVTRTWREAVERGGNPAVFERWVLE